MQQEYRSKFTGLLSLLTSVLGLFFSFATLTAVAGNLTIASNNLPSPKLAFVGKETYTVRGRQFDRYKLDVTKWNVYPATLFNPAPNLPPCGANSNSSRTWVNIYNAQTNSRLYGFCALSSPKNLTSLWFAVEKGKTPPKSVYIDLKDRKLNQTYRSNDVTIVSN